LFCERSVPQFPFPAAALLLASGLALAACNSASQTERAIAGAAVGGAAGTGAGWLLGGNAGAAVAGGMVGAAGGGLIGALTPGKCVKRGPDGIYYRLPCPE
jgi:hypothetical protein